MTHVVVCIVGFRNLDDVATCLDALSASTHHDFEVVLCENGGRAHRDALAEQYKGGALPSGQPVEVLPYAGNSGYAGGNNRCIQARGDAPVWWILNPDTRVSPDTMAQLVECLDSDHADAVGGTLLNANGRVQAYGGYWNRRTGRAVSAGFGRVFSADDALAGAPYDYIVGASLMFTRAFLERAGPMREDYFLYGEEVEWCLRAKACGLRLGVAPAAMITHAQGTTTGDHGQFNQKPKLPVYLDQRNKILIFRDIYRDRLVAGMIGSLLFWVVRVARNKAWRQFGYGLAGWFAGVRNQRGMPPWLRQPPD